MGFLICGCGGDRRRLKFRAKVCKVSTAHDARIVPRFGGSTSVDARTCTNSRYFDGKVYKCFSRKHTTLRFPGRQPEDFFLVSCLRMG